MMRTFGTLALVVSAALGVTACVASPVSSAPPVSMDMFAGGSRCYDRDAMPHTAVVDTHLHFRPFGGPALPFTEVLSYLERSGVLFANIYGIGQMLPVFSTCTYYLDCLGTPVKPTLKNDFVNAANVAAYKPESARLVLSMTFPNLAAPSAVLDGIHLLDAEFPGMFRWMGEVNLVKQALFGNGHRPVPLATIRRWAPFMAVLRERGIPIAIHSDLGDNAEPMKYLAWIEEVLRRYPDNIVVWMHLGLSKELTQVDPEVHIGVMERLLAEHPKLLLDLSWRVIEDNVFADPAVRARYVAFINAHSERFLPGTDFVASANKNFTIYQEELAVTGRIHQHLDDEAFRNIALGQNYFRVLGLDHQAPAVCESPTRERQTL